MSDEPFAPNGMTVTIMAALTATAPVKVPSGQQTQYELQVVGEDPMFFTWGSSASSTPPAQWPTTEAPAWGYLVPAGQSKIITAVKDAWFSAISTGSDSYAMIVAGTGQ